jgi:hypothetical protein
LAAEGHRRFAQRHTRVRGQVSDIGHEAACPRHGLASRARDTPNA